MEHISFSKLIRELDSIKVKETTTTKLQKLESDFYEKVHKFIELNSKNEQITASELEQIKKNVDKIYFKRVEKILLDAAYSFWSKNSQVSSNFLDIEKELFNETITLLEKYKKEIVHHSKKKAIEQQKNQKKVEFETEKCDNKNEPNMNDYLEKRRKIPIKFLTNVPAFVGKNHSKETPEVYGPFNYGDVVALPEEISNLIIKRGKGKKVV